MVNYFFDILTQIWWNSCIGKAYMDAIFLFCQRKRILLKKFNLIILLLLIPTYLLRNFTNFSKKHKILHVCWLCKKFITDLSCFLSKNFRKPCAGKRITSIWTTPPDGSDEDSVAAVRISHIGMHWNRDLVQSYAFPNFADILRCFVSQEQNCPSAVRPPPTLYHTIDTHPKSGDKRARFTVTTLYCFRVTLIKKFIDYSNIGIYRIFISAAKVLKLGRFLSSSTSYGMLR